MTYSPTTWERNTTAATAALLNNQEAGIVALDTCTGSAISAPTRALNTVYTNSAGKTVIVMVSVTLSASTASHILWQVKVTVGGTTYTPVYFSKASNAYALTDCAMFAVPPGATYEVDGDAAYVTIDTWTECAVH